MRTLLILLAVFLTGCAKQSILISSPLKEELLVRCPSTIAQPLTTGDRYDLSRALVESQTYGKSCKARMDALVNAIEIRDQTLQSVKLQIEGVK